ncbi:AAA family ATPase [Caldisericum sp.]|uniref:AAA family ATPase n=1 Tax=Caldisericum sp. TaxID=2499687 RepID=UPI003D14637D
MDPFEKLMTIVDANEKLASTTTSVQTLVPCLIGETGVGKTTLVEKLAAEKGMPLRRILLHSMLEEEILGIPRVQDGRTVWSRPEWVVEDGPAVYFFDELDKVRVGLIGSVLTVLANKTVRDNKLHPNSIIVAAMQPTDEWSLDETGKALLARLIFIPVRSESTKKFIEQKYGIKLLVDIKDEYEIPYLPKPSWRQIDYALALAKVLPRDQWQEITSGFLKPDVQSLLLESINSSGWFMRPEELVALINQDESLLHKLSVAELIDLAADILIHGSPRTIALAEAMVIRNGSPEDWGRYCEARFKGTAERLSQSPDGSIEAANGADVREVYDAYVKIVVPAIQERARQKEKGEK